MSFFELSFFSGPVRAFFAPLAGGVRAILLLVGFWILAFPGIGALPFAEILGGGLLRAEAPVRPVAPGDPGTSSAPDPFRGQPLQKILEKVDRQLARPDGLHRGTITILLRGEPPYIRDFELIRRGSQAYLSLRSARRGEELRLLWTGQGLTVWSFDVVRRVLSHLEEGQVFDAGTDAGFAPADFFYPWFSANIVPETWREDTLTPGLHIIVGRTLTGGWQGRLGVGIDSAERPVRLEVTDSKGILLRVVEFQAGKPILEWKSHREFLPSWPALYELMDVRHGRIARFETRIFDPGFRPDPALFDPDFLSR